MSEWRRDASEEIRQVIHHIIDDVWQGSKPCDRKIIAEFVADANDRLGRPVDAAHLRVLVSHW